MNRGSGILAIDREKMVFAGFRIALPVHFCVIGLLSLSACGSGSQNNNGILDANGVDVLVFDGHVDALIDSRVADGSLDGSQDGSGDGAAPDFGELSGQCGELDDEEWNAAAPFRFRNAIDFGTVGFDLNLLSPGGREIWDDGNLGGSSIHSEIIAFEVLYRCEQASLLKTEGEILYLDDGGKKTDILVSIDGWKVGVSVTRAFHFPPANPYTVPEAYDLLVQKLSDVQLSAANADPGDAWQRSILHVVAYDGQYADTVETAYDTLDATTLSDTIVWITVTDGDDDFVY